MFEILETVLYVMTALMVIMLVPIFAGGAAMMLMPFAYLVEFITFLLKKIVENGRSIIELMKNSKSSSFVDVLKLSGFQIGCAIVVILCVPLCIFSILLAMFTALTPVVIASVYCWQEYIIASQNSTMIGLLVAWSICYVVALIAFGVAMFRDDL